MAILGRKAQNEKVFCHAREVRIRLAPHRWLDILETAMANPERVVRDEDLKLTVKADLSPWGPVCAQRIDWSVKKMLLSAIRPFRRKAYWKNLTGLWKKDVPIVEPLLYLEVREGRMTTRSYFVSRWMEAESLGKTVARAKGGTDRKVVNLLKRATNDISYMHNLGYLHGDPEWTNILVDPDVATRIAFCGLEDARKSAAYSDHGKDLARFVFSAYEYELGRETADDLVSWYFYASGYRPESFDKALVRELARLESQYRYL